MDDRLDPWGSSNVSIKVIGVGGGGGNAVNRMVGDFPSGVDFVTVNTDTQVLRYSRAESKIQIGAKVARGMGAGADPTSGERPPRRAGRCSRRLSAEPHSVFIHRRHGRRDRQQVVRRVIAQSCARARHSDHCHRNKTVCVRRTSACQSRSGRNQGTSRQRRRALLSFPTSVCSGWRRARLRSATRSGRPMR